MMQITPQMRIFIAIEPVDFRKGIDGLMSVCRKMPMSDPFSGHVFVFRNRLGTAIKILVYDGQGFWLLQKRLSKGKFKWWPRDNNNGISQLSASELQLLILNGDPTKSEIQPDWRQIET